jgi:long-chain acyl-CoA synthetase
VTILSLASVLAEAARRYPDKTAIVDPYQRVTYRDLWQQARAYAAGLRELGVKPGDAVALQCPNIADFPRAYYGILAAGAAVVPVHLLLTPDEIAYVLKDSGATLLISHAAVLQNGAPAAGAAGIPLVTLGPVPADVPVKRLEEVSASVPPLPLHLSREAEDPAVIFYTSGTTGEPKGAVLSHLNLVLNATVNAFDCNDVSPSDIAFGALPLFHTYGQTVSMNASFRLGMTVVLLPRFTGEAAIDLMLAENVNIFHGVPTM